MAYKKAPIVEAVIELRFARQAEFRAVEDAARRLRDEYFYQDPDNGLNVKIDAGTGKSEVETIWQGFKLSSVDRADALFYRTSAMVCSRLAPYTGWEHFCPRAIRAWEVWKRTAGPTELVRIGVRYINRIDVPVENDRLINVEDYLNIVPKTPDGLPPMASFAMQTAMPLGADDCSLTMNTGTMLAPLIGFVSFALDIDVFREANIPRRDDELWALVNRIREHKNRIFESCITAKARALFE
jgi:uncharacterized protein (TIGR04255 family)